MTKYKYDYLIVGAGFTGATIARELSSNGNKKVLVVDSRNHIGGNAYSKDIADIHVHMYGAHIFHTNSEKIWKYVKNFSRFYGYVHNVRAVYKDKSYTLPFNLNTFGEIYGLPPIKEVVEDYLKVNTTYTIKDDLESWVLSKLPKEIYEILIKGYTKKQWGIDPSELPSSIIKRIPIRFNTDNNYFNNSKYCGIPVDGYDFLFENLLDSIPVELNTYISSYDEMKSIANNIIFTGPIDEFFDFKYGILKYRSLRFDHKILFQNTFQELPVINYTDEEVPYTRIIEHKNFDYNTKHNPNIDYTIVTYEYPDHHGSDKYYPVVQKTELDKYNQYIKFAERETPDVTFCGRLGSYKYIDMDQAIGQAFNVTKNILKG